MLSGCSSSKKQLERGNYDVAISEAVKQLRKNPNDSKQITTLERSYAIVNEQDLERIRFLKMEGRPQNYDEIYQIYKRLNDRQSLVRTVLPLRSGGRTIEFPFTDYLQEMISAKRKSADFYYTHGIELMKNCLKDSYRQAFYEFMRAKEYVGDYDGIENKIMEAKELGMSRVFVSLQNNTMIRFPQEFEEEMLNLNLQALNSEWVEFHTITLDEETQYDYFININLKNIIVSPDQTSQIDSLIKKDVEDGFTFQLDQKGNVMRDSLGNSIKMKKYKTLQCALISTLQTKSCQINADIEIIQANPNKLLKKNPVGTHSIFENISARAIGDIEALDSRQLAKTKSQIIPFPSDIEMIMRCSESLKKAIWESIQSSRMLII